MRYLLTFDKKIFTKLDNFTIYPGRQEAFQLPIISGTVRYVRSAPDRFEFAAEIPWPDGMEGFVLSSEGKIYFLLVGAISLNTGQPQNYSGFITETGTPDKKQIDELFEKHP